MNCTEFLELILMSSVNSLNSTHILLYREVINFECLKGKAKKGWVSCRENGVRIFSEVNRKRIRKNGQNLQQMQERKLPDKDLSNQILL